MYSTTPVEVRIRRDPEEDPTSKYRTLEVEIIDGQSCSCRPRKSGHMCDVCYVDYLIREGGLYAEDWPEYDKDEWTTTKLRAVDEYYDTMDGREYDSWLEEEK